MTPAALWRFDWEAAGLEPPMPFRDLRTVYSSPPRYYHNLVHVVSCLNALRLNGVVDDNLNAIRLALWCHDAFYNTHRDDNESLSATFAKESVLRVGGSTLLAGDVERLILATTHRADSSRRDEQLVCDADLSPLAADVGIRRLDDSVRREYDWVPARAFAAKRVEVLSAFLERPQIFRTAEFAHMESLARSNLRWIVERWKNVADSKEG